MTPSSGCPGGEGRAVAQWQTEPAGVLWKTRSDGAGRSPALPQRLPSLPPLAVESKGPPPAAIGRGIWRGLKDSRGPQRGLHKSGSGPAGGDAPGLGRGCAERAAVNLPQGWGTCGSMGSRGARSALTGSVTLGHSPPASAGLRALLGHRGPHPEAWGPDAHLHLRPTLRAPGSGRGQGGAEGAGLSLRTAGSPFAATPA